MATELIKIDEVKTSFHPFRTSSEGILTLSRNAMKPVKLSLIQSKEKV